MVCENAVLNLSTRVLPQGSKGNGRFPAGRIIQRMPGIGIPVCLADRIGVYGRVSAGYRNRRDILHYGGSVFAGYHRIHHLTIRIQYLITGTVNQEPVIIFGRDADGAGIGCLCDLFTAHGRRI